MIKKLTNDIWIIEEDNHISKAVESLGRLDQNDWIKDYLKQYVMDGNTVVEGGAYIGDTTKIFLDMRCEVYAFEPNSEAYQCLEHNCSEAFIYDRALSDGAHEFNLHVPYDNPGAARIIENKAERRIISMKIDKIKLDACNVIYLSTEGYIDPILKGALKTIKKFHPVLIINNCGILSMQQL